MLKHNIFQLYITRCAIIIIIIIFAFPVEARVIRRTRRCMAFNERDEKLVVGEILSFNPSTTNSTIEISFQYYIITYCICAETQNRIIGKRTLKSSDFTLLKFPLFCINRE